MAFYLLLEDYLTNMLDGCFYKWLTARVGKPRSFLLNVFIGIFWQFVHLSERSLVHLFSSVCVCVGVGVGVCGCVCGCVCVCVCACLFFCSKSVKFFICLYIWLSVYLIVCLSDYLLYDSLSIWLSVNLIVCLSNCLFICSVISFLPVRKSLWLFSVSSKVFLSICLFIWLLCSSIYYSRPRS